jgi:hypothetical protein
VKINRHTKDMKKDEIYYNQSSKSVNN